MITLAIAGALFISWFVNTTVFLANSPHIRTNAGTNFLAHLDPRNWGAYFEDQQKQNEIDKRFAELPLTQVSRGVYAKSYANKAQTVVKVAEMEWISQTVLVDGKEYTVYIPSDAAVSPEALADVVRSQHKQQEDK
ncbi:hypothetical protein KC726_03115 [Candidatus Woesebacteria bacterium]|nr:hypothetical protein [Candidatus Woesebacteria bacterium]